MTIMTITSEDSNSDLGPFDVLCGRDKQSYNNIGNRRFRIMININLQKYMKCETRTERSRMILDLSDEFRNFCGQYRFLKWAKGGQENNSTLVQLDYKQSREKIAHALRDAASQYRTMKRKQTMERGAKNQSITTSTIDIQSVSTTSRSQEVYYEQLVELAKELEFPNAPDTDYNLWEGPAFADKIKAQAISPEAMSNIEEQLAGNLQNEIADVEELSQHLRISEIFDCD